MLKKKVSVLSRVRFRREDGGWMFVCLMYSHLQQHTASGSWWYLLYRYGRVLIFLSNSRQETKMHFSKCQTIACKMLLIHTS